MLKIYYNIIIVILYNYVYDRTQAEGYGDSVQEREGVHKKI